MSRKQNEVDPDEHPLVRKQEARALLDLLLRWRAYQTVSVAAILIGAVVGALGGNQFGGLLLIIGGLMFGAVGIMRSRYERRLRKFVARYHVLPREILAND